MIIAIVLHNMSHLISLSNFNLPLIGTFTWPTPPGPYRATTCRGRELNYGSIDILFWPHKDMEDLPGWVISPMPGPPPRQHKHERQYTPSRHSDIPTKRIWNDDYDGQMIFGDLGRPKVSWNFSYRWGKTTNPGPLHDKYACYLPPGPQRWMLNMDILLGRLILYQSCKFFSFKIYDCKFSLINWLNNFMLYRNVRWNNIKNSKGTTQEI